MKKKHTQVLSKAGVYWQEVSPGSPQKHNYVMSICGSQPGAMSLPTASLFIDDDCLESSKV